MENNRPASLRLDSDAFGASRDMRVWREEVARSVLGLDFAPLDDTPFRARLTATMAGDVTLSHMRLTPAATIRDMALTDTNSNTFTFAWAENGPLRAGQRHQDHTLQPGEGVLLSSDEIGHLTSPVGGRYFGIILPRAAIARHSVGPDDRIMRLLPRNSRQMRLVTAYCRFVERQAADADEAGRHMMGEHLTGLIGLALAAGAEASRLDDRPQVQQARLGMIKEMIDAMADEPGLTIAALAQACGLSPRYIQLLFEQSGTSFSSHVLNLRLERAHRLLSGLGNENMRVIDAALSVGFSDVSYFNRRFRARYGETPTAVRSRPRKP